MPSRTDINILVGIIVKFLFIKFRFGDIYFFGNCRFWLRNIRSDFVIYKGIYKLNRIFFLPACLRAGM